MAGDWYEGGTLHKATISTWQQADFNNKLATAGDWVLTGSPKIKQIVSDSGSINTLKPYASELTICIDKAVEGTGQESSQAASIAVLCMMTMGYI